MIVLSTQFVLLYNLVFHYSVMKYVIISLNLYMIRGKIIVEIYQKFVRQSAQIIMIVSCAIKYVKHLALSVVMMNVMMVAMGQITVYVHQDQIVTIVDTDCHRIVHL